MIGNIKLFLKNPTESRIYGVLNVNDKEAAVLKKMLEYYLEGLEDVKVRNLLYEIFSDDNLKALENIDVIKNLLDEGWIIVSSFSQIKNSDLSMLEVFNSSISLSVAFLKLIEQGSLDLVIPKKTPYKDHLEYLHDQFLRIEIYEQLSSVKMNLSKESTSIKRLQSKLKLIENTIKEKIKKTKIDLLVQNFIEEYELNEKEEILFLALLKEEYTSSNEQAREQNYLLNLISVDEIERIKNRTLLDDNSKLISEGIFEYDELIGAFGGYSKIYFLNEEILNELVHPRKHKIEHVVKDTIFDLMEPKIGLDAVVLPQKTKEMLQVLLKQIDKRVLKRLKEWGIKQGSNIEAKIIFYGPPGTGKTLTANAIAKELNKPVLSLDSSKILSMYVGESEKNVRRMFDEYYSVMEKLKTKPVLLLNEADQFLSSRTVSALSSADKMHNQMQNIFLEQLEKFDGLLIATTNLLETIDSAFSRRFEYKIKFEKPSFKERKKLWQLKLPTNAEYEENFDINKLSSYELTGAQIEVIIKNTALKVAMRKKPVFKTEDFINEINREKRNAFDSEKELGFV
jgi:AAA+ superfamily predicted ATPase